MTDESNKGNDAKPPPPKWYESSRGKLVVKVCSAAIGAAAGWAILQWSGRILGS